MNRGEEDYIKAIYQVRENEVDKGQSYVSNHSLVEYLGHTPQTVNETIKKLAHKKLLIYKPYHGCQLTETGEQIAIRLIRVHRLWELFLTEKLGYQWDEVHDDAEQMEHTTSEVLEQRLYYFLGEPTYCPHGNVIPDLNGKTETVELISLAQAMPDKPYQLKRVADNQELLKYLNQKGIGRGDILVVKERDSFSQILRLEKAGQDIFVGFMVAKDIFVGEIN